MSKWTIAALSLILVGSNLFWIYRVFDSGVTMTYMEAGQDLERAQRDQLVVLSNLDVIGLSMEEAKQKIGNDVHGNELFFKEGCIWASQVCIEIEDDRVSRIRLSSDQ